MDPLWLLILGAGAIGSGVFASKKSDSPDENEMRKDFEDWIEVQQRERWERSWQEDRDRDKIGF